jgi:predicted type IV restriction endonuclease
MFSPDAGAVATTSILPGVSTVIKVSKRFVDRARGNLRRYQRVLETARSRDVNESDTCVIVSDIVSDILGYDKYTEVTTEFAIRSTFCDLAIKLDGNLQYLIEVKSIGTELKENHLKQAVDYAANQGVDWVLLTNGVIWRAYRLRFEKPIQHDEVFAVDLLDPATKPSQLLEKLYLISREAAGSAALGSYARQREATSRYVVAQLLLDDSVLTTVRRQLRRLFPGVRVSTDEIAAFLRNEVLKREALEGERADAAEKLVRRASRKHQRTKNDRVQEPPPVLAAEAKLPEPQLHTAPARVPGA